VGERVAQVYEVVSKIFGTGASIYTAVVVARSTGPNRPNCKFRVLLWRFEATAWKRAKTSHRTLARTDLAALSWWRPVSHFRSHPAFSSDIQNGCHSHPPYYPDLAPCDCFVFPKMRLKLKDAGLIPLRRLQTESPRVLDTLKEKKFHKAFQKWRKLCNRCVHAGGNYFKGDGGR
jgi:hypothetical protein